MIKLFRLSKFGYLNLTFPLCVFDFSRKANVEFGNYLLMRRNVQIAVRKEGELKIGKNCFFNSNCVLICHQNISIDHTCKFGPGVMMFDHNHNMKDKNTVTDDKKLFLMK